MNHSTTTSRKKFALLLIAPAAVAVAIAGCGGSSTKTDSQAVFGQAATTAKAAPALRLAGLKPGKALVDAQGRTLYLFEADKRNASACNGPCASIWPPATVSGRAAAAAGLSAAKLGTTKRSDGKLQLTYNGHPLYRYAADTKPGDVNGQGLNQFGAKWYVLSASGAKIDND